MRAVIQRVAKAEVSVEGAGVGAIERGLVALVAAGDGDGPEDAHWIARKIAGLRVFEDADGRMNLGLDEVGGAVLVVSQFTLYGDCRKGRRPSFVHAMAPEPAAELLEVVIEDLRRAGLHVETGRFQAHMQVSLVNDGPVTLWLDSRQEK